MPQPRGKKRSAPEGTVLGDIASGTADPTQPDAEDIRHGAQNKKAAIRKELLHSWRRCIDAASISAARTYNPEAQQDFALFLPRVDRTHLFYSLRNILFCDRCGYWSMKRPRMLAQPCPGQPRDGQQNMLRRMRGGFHPDRASWPDGTSGIYPVYRVVNPDSTASDHRHTEGTVRSGTSG